VHLAAVVPYYFAIQSVIAIGQPQSTQPLAYWNASAIPWIIGIILNLIGMILNRVPIGRRARARAAEAKATSALQTPRR
jgi:hypothetical protein